jgi:hypothetical protein
MAILTNTKRFMPHQIPDIKIELQQQVTLLNALYNKMMRQKDLLEQQDYINLFISQTQIEELSQTLQQKRSQLSSIHEFYFLENVPCQVKDLLDQLSDLTERVLVVENQCHETIENSQQKIGETINAIIS